MNWKDYYNQKTKEIIFLAYFFVIVLTGIGLISSFSLDSLSTEWDKIFSFLIGFLLFITLSLLLLSIFEGISNKKFLFITYILNIILLILISILIFLAGQNVHLFKMLLTLPVIIASLRGLKPGLIFAVLTGCIVLYSNKFYSICENNLNFNVIYNGIFIYTAWLIGSFVDLEKRTKSELENLANLDDLTGLYNCRYFKNLLIDAIDNLAESEIMAVIAIDIDYYRDYFDMFGLQRANLLVQKIANIIKDSLGKKAFAASFEESSFIILIPDNSLSNVYTFAESIRKEVENTLFFGEKYLPAQKITISLGIASCSKNSNSISASGLIKRANETLFRAKAMGPNRTELFSSIFVELEKEVNHDEMGLLSSLKIFLLILNTRDKYTYAHSERVMGYSMKIAAAMGIKEEEKKALLYASFFHDIGKVEIDKDILGKPEKLTATEKAILKKHPLYGAAMLKPIEALRDSVPIVMHHHENIDGSGYPDGLTGAEIPLGARILRIANSFDSMVTKRPYRSKMPLNEAILILKKYSGIYYEPGIVDIFISILKKE